MRITIIDYGMGNLHSVSKKIKALGHTPIVTSDPKEILKAEKIILPGVGHFGKAMENLQKNGLIAVLNKVVLEDKKPILGICLGMQLMATKSEEGNSKGLGWIEGEVIKFDVNNTLKYKVPHTGWNQINKTKESPLMIDIPDLAEFYFVHSYHWKTTTKEFITNVTEYEYLFPSAVEKNNIFGVQYHPEKSHDNGNILLNNFIKL